MHISWTDAALFPPVARRTASGAVVELIRGHILAGDLPPGHRLPPRRRLAALLHVSMATVGAAFCTLKEMGLVRASPGFGTFVVRHPVERRTLDLMVGRADPAELGRLRALIDIHAAAIAARKVHEERHAPAALSELNMWVSEHQRSRSVSPRNLAESDARVHVAVGRVGGRELFAATRLRATIDSCLRAVFLDREAMQRLRDARLADLHAALVTAILNGDEPRAASTARAVAEIESSVHGAALG